MESFLFYTVVLLVIVIIIALPFGIGWLLFFIPKKLGYPKLAKYLLLTYCLAVITVALLLIFEDQLFTRNEAKELVETHTIKLQDKFEIINNSSSFSPGNYHHIFTLKISARDDYRAKQIIKNAAKLNPKKISMDSLVLSPENHYFGPKVEHAYETEDVFISEHFHPSGQQRYAPLYTTIAVRKTENTLIFEDIDK